ncbi:JAB domain-containing protein [Flavobacterium sp. N3904]|uniref:JAB domain-containing protein n=1 Tax=Flavobacterium sp. N3904 TaxID=2986835 RepID=UPI0022258D56|nr:JAB domain-containing protein [Flavobacterium sp. N3904]
MINELAEIHVSYRTNNYNKIKITSIQIAFELLVNSWCKDTIELQEEFKVILLNRSNETLGIYSLSKGGTTGTVVDVRLLFAVALKCNSTGIIISHNHPSGKLQPSDIDITLTKKIKKCSEFLDIVLLDHLIVTKNGYYSFSNEGLI